MTSTKNNNKNENDFDRDVISNIPDLQIAQQYFLFKKVEQSAKAEKFTALLNRIKDNEMGPFYEYISQDSNIKIDRALLKNLLEKNTKILSEIDAEIKDAEENLGESDVRQAWLKKFEYFCQIGDKNGAINAFQNTFDKTVGLGYRIDLVFNLIRLGLFFLDHKLISANITRAKELMEQGGDWDRKNRLRCYEGLYKMIIRNFDDAAALFLEVVPTFSSTELITYEDLIFYTVITCMYSLDRPDLYSKVIRCNEIQEQLNGGGTNGALVPVKKFLDSFYGCVYNQFYLLLAQLEVERLKIDRYLEPHYYFYSRSMRLRAYTQFLAPYKTVRLDMMAKDFGVSKEFIDKELYAQVSDGLLKCRIDAVNEIIEITHSDKRNDLYKSLIHDSDTLFNRVQKLARIIHS